MIPAHIPLIKMQYLLEAHDRFLINYLAGTTGQALDDLWAVTSGFCSPQADVRWMTNEVDRILQSREAATVTQLSGEFQRRIDDVVARGADEDDPTAR